MLYPVAKAILPRLATCVFSKAENLRRLFMIHPVYFFEIYLTEIDPYYQRQKDRCTYRA